jgi:hypothetical protein
MSHPMIHPEVSTARDASPHPVTDIGRRNVVWGWGMISMGAVTGLIIMAWSFAGPFPTPSGFHDYGDLPRRMMRLAHIALFMLPIINILIGKDLDRARLTARWKQICSVSALVAMIGIPLGLTLAATIDVRLKYVAMLPSYALLFALAIMGLGMVRRR